MARVLEWVSAGSLGVKARGALIPGLSPAALGRLWSPGSGGAGGHPQHAEIMHMCWPALTLRPQLVSPLRTGPLWHWNS